MWSTPRLSDLLPIATGIGTVLYPFAVYFSAPRISPTVLVLLAIALGGLHLLRHRLLGHSLMPRWGFVLIPFVLLLLLKLLPVLAVQAYPPLVSLSLAAGFGWSLIRPPSAIEHLARLSDPNLPPEGVAYTRAVTVIWTAFFIVNAIISIVLAGWFSVAVWALWTGLLSYLAIGLLFGGEILVRRWKFQRVTL